MKEGRPEQPNNIQEGCENQQQAITSNRQLETEDGGGREKRQYHTKGIFLQALEAIPRQELQGELEKWWSRTNPPEKKRPEQESNPDPLA